MTKLENPNPEEFDVIIAGGGLVGLSLALALDNGGLKVGVVDILSPSKMLESEYDGRSSAIAYSAMRMLDVLGVKSQLIEYETINKITVVDGKVKDGARKGGPMGLSLYFDCDEITETDEPLGYMVENRHMRLALDKVADTHKNISRFTPNKVIGFENIGPKVLVKLDNGTQIKAKLLVGADGRGSLIRKQSQIKTMKFGYNQTGIVTTIKFEKPHNNVAYEYFLPNGPFAVLPLQNNRACIVWSEPHAKAMALKSLPKENIEAEIQKRIGNFLGKVEVCAPIFAYPLSLELADKWYIPRVALIGDAQHGIHPVAGQGFNLGLKDVAAMAEILTEAHKLGLDIGDTTILEQYAAWRRTDTMMVALACDAFVRIFSNDIAPLRLARNLGLGIVNKIGPVRRFFARHAGGVVGELPKLLQGQNI